MFVGGNFSIAPDDRFAFFVKHGTFLQKCLTREDRFTIFGKCGDFFAKTAGHCSSLFMDSAWGAERPRK